MSSQCLKSTKTNNKALAHIQTLTLTPSLNDLLEKLNSDKTEISAEEVEYAVESAVTLLGNVLSQIPGLRTQKVLKEYNKDLLSFAKEREATFIKAASLLFGPQFPKDATDYLEQVGVLKRANSSSSYNLNFHKALLSQRLSRQSYAKAKRQALYKAEGCQCQEDISSE